MINSITKNNKGSVLLYSLLVISLITAIAIIISVIVVNEIKQTTAASNGIQAYYAAESGIEKGLYAVKILRNDQTKDLEQAVLDISSFFDNDFENNASFENIQTDYITAKVVNVNVPENDFIQIDYYDVNNPLAPAPGNIVVGITVKNSGGDLATWAEVSWTAWDQNGVLGTSTEAKKLIGPSDLARTDGWPINNLDVFELDPETGFDGTPVGYRVRVKALKAIPTEVGDGDLSSLTVIPYDNTPPPLGSGNEVVDLPSQLVIKSVGERSNFKQSLVATVPWSLPLFGLYDYVLFSEGELLKDIILSAPTYTSGLQETDAGLTDSGSQCSFGVTPPSCGVCQSYGWEGWCPTGTVNVACWAEGGDPTKPWDGTCKIRPQAYLDTVLNPNGYYKYYGFTTPIPDTVPQGEEYYVSLRIGYACENGGSMTTICDNRDISVEINNQAVVIQDLASGQPTGYESVQWTSCTIPDSFSLGDPALPFDDESRSIKITNHPYGPIGYDPGVTPYPGTGWKEGTQDYALIDWYQLSTYKIFPDCY